MAATRQLPIAPGIKRVRRFHFIPPQSSGYMHGDPTAPHRRLRLAAKQVRLAAEALNERDGTVDDSLEEVADELHDKAAEVERAK